MPPELFESLCSEPEMCQATVGILIFNIQLVLEDNRFKRVQVPLRHCYKEYAGGVMNVVSAVVILVLSFAFIVTFSLPYKRVGKAKVLCICILVCFWTFDSLKIVLMRPVIFKISKF
jgi:hypothetical protein